MAGERDCTQILHEIAARDGRSDGNPRQWNTTPPNAIAFSTGVVPLVRMIRHGFWLDVIGSVVVVTCVLLLAP